MLSVAGKVVKCGWESFQMFNYAPTSARQQMDANILSMAKVIGKKQSAIGRKQHLHLALRDGSRIPMTFIS